ncbi:MAG: cytochrome d ubiquinol oxidase subunit II [bacterium]
MIEIWYAILSFMLAMFVVLEGLDIGAGMLQYLVGKTDKERRMVIAAIGPLWSWHEVWLVGFGGTLMVAFPKILAVSFSGFYLALFLLLWVLVLRGVSIEVSGHLSDPLWRTAWHFVFTFANILLAILIGAALGNLLRGVPLDSTGNFSLAFFTNFEPNGNVGILDWFTVSASLFTFITFAAHGANALALKTEGPVHSRSLRTAKRLWKIIPVLLAVLTFESWKVRPELFSNLSQKPLVWFASIIVLAGLIAIITGLKKDHCLRAVLGSCAFIAGLMASCAAGVFPTMLYSTLSPTNSLSAYQNASTSYSLAVALVWWPIALVLAIGYFIFIYRHYTGKVAALDDTQSPY